MARSTTSMCNLALNLIGDKQRITELDDDQSVTANVCRLVFPEIRDQVLAEPSVEWVCARTRKQLTLLSSTPSFGWSYQYTVPAGCLRVVAVVASSGDTRGIPWRRESNRLLLNNNECYILYIQQIADVTQYSPALAKAIYVKMAAELATRVAGNKVKARDLLQVYLEEALPEAVAANQAEVYVEDEHGHTTWVDAG